jgi:hypothetical protein
MYEIEFHLRAPQDLEKVDRVVASRILAKTRWLAANLDVIKPEPLVDDLKVCGSYVWAITGSFTRQTVKGTC